MPKDNRLYMTLPIEFPEHPKVEPLSDKAFRAFIEMNAYSRRVETDGVIPKTVAEKRWGKKALTELVDTDADKPLISVTGSDYVIRDYAEHQETKASREARAEKNRANGARGGRPRNPELTQSVSSGLENGNPNITQNNPESESESESELTRLNNVSYLLNREGEFEDDDNLKMVRESTFTGMGITNSKALHALIVKSTDREVSEVEAFGIILDLLSKATGDVKNPQAYVATAIKNSWAELQQSIDEGAVA